ncbi:hypothetical protein FRC12_007579 [Ceratobasidium sp. 428]|nr:hypothetical protein FRC12_007579 [Ceratobasidium sp. 428]
MSTSKPHYWDAMGHLPGADLHPWLVLLQPGLPCSVNGMWAIPCVWVNATALLQTIGTATNYQPACVAVANPAPTQSSTLDWAPRQPMSSSAFEPEVHPFGAIDPMVCDLMYNLSPEDAQFLAASYPSTGQTDEPIEFAEDFSGGSALGLQLDNAKTPYFTPINQLTAPRDTSAFVSSNHHEFTPQITNPSNIEPCDLDFSTPNISARTNASPQLSVVVGPNTSIAAGPATVTVGTPIVRRHSTQIGVGLVPSPGNPTLCAESPNPDMARGRTSAGDCIPSAPAVGNCPPLRLVPDATAVLHHVSAPNTPAMRLRPRPSLPQLHGLAVSAPGSRLGSPLPSTPRSRSPFVAVSRSGSPAPMPSTPRTRFHQAGRLRSISPPRSPGSFTSQIHSPLPGTPLHLAGGFDSDAGQPSHPAAYDRVDSDYHLNRPRAHRQRTPPPLAAGANQIYPTSAPAFSRGEDGFAVPGESSPHAARAAPLPTPLRFPLRHCSISDAAAPEKPRDGPTPVAPTIAEFKARQAKEIRDIYNARKSNPPAVWNPNEGGDESHMSEKEKREKEGKGKGGIRRIWAYSHTEQSVMNLMRAYIQWDLIHVGPWNDLDEQRFQRALEFVKTATNYNAEQMGEEHFRTLKQTNGQLRTAGQNDIKTEVAAFFRVKAGEDQKVE